MKLPLPLAAEVVEEVQMRQVLRQLLAQAATAATELHRLFLAAALPMQVVVAVVQIQTPHHLQMVPEALAAVATLFVTDGDAGMAA